MHILFCALCFKKERLRVLNELGMEWNGMEMEMEFGFYYNTGLFVCVFVLAFSAIMLFEMFQKGQAGEAEHHVGIPVLVMEF